MTSAPCSASSNTPRGPAIPHERSRIRTPASAPGMAPNLARNGDAEAGPEPVTRLADRRAGASERVDFGRHRFDGDVLAIGRHEELGERVVRIEPQREFAARRRDRENAVAAERVVIVEDSLLD